MELFLTISFWICISFSTKTMKLILASLIASAAAFAPVSQKAASTTSLNAFEGELGTFFSSLRYSQENSAPKRGKVVRSVGWCRGSNICRSSVWT
jgi:hypothetical protein